MTIGQKLAPRPTGPAGLGAVPQLSPALLAAIAVGAIAAGYLVYLLATGLNRSRKEKRQGRRRQAEAAAKRRYEYETARAAYRFGD